MAQWSRQVSEVPLHAWAWLADGFTKVEPDGVHWMTAIFQPRGQLCKTESTGQSSTPFSLYSWQVLPWMSSVTFH